MSNEDTELLKEFAVESQEHLADIENQLLTLESQGDNMDVALVNTVFRAIHSIKGAAGFMGLDTLGGLAHRAEEVLNRLRNKELKPTSVVINTLLKAADRLKDLIDQIETSNKVDVSSHLVALELILSGDEAAVQAPAVPATVVAATPSNGISSEALREFLIESFDNLEQAERDLLALERQPEAESFINSVFRSVHTIKGSSGFLGYAKLEKLTHVAESLLGSVRAGNFAFDGAVSERLFTTIDAVRKMLQTIESEGSEGVDDCAELIANLETFQTLKLSGESSKTDKKPKATKKAPAAKKAAPTSVAAPIKEPAATASPSVAAKPQPAAVAKETAPVPAAVSTPAAATPAVATAAIAKPVAAPAPIAAPTPAAAPKPPNNAQASTGGESSAADSTIRVDVALLDKLMTRVGELVLARNQILQFNSTINDHPLHGATQRLNLITTELQEGVMKTRMQPIGTVWSKFPRLVRDLATICEKEVRIEMEGKETELDKTIIEAIKDPLTHLVRNTVDHGIERAEVRVQNGKPAEGCLTLRAYHEGGQVNIEICDDGAGLKSIESRRKPSSVA